MEKHCCQTLGHDASGGTVHSRDGQPPLDIFAPLKKMPVQWSHSPGAAPSKQSADPCLYQAGGIASAGTLSILSWECTSMVLLGTDHKSRQLAPCFVWAKLRAAKPCCPQSMAGMVTGSRKAVSGCRTQTQLHSQHPPGLSHLFVWLVISLQTSSKLPNK